MPESRVPAPCLTPSDTENSTPASVRVLSSQHLFEDRKNRRERNNKKISLHRFKPIIFSKMIQNCLNQVGRWSQQARRGARACHRGRGAARLLTGVDSRQPCPSASLPSPGTRVHVGGPPRSPWRWQRLESVRLVCVLSPHGRCWVGGLESPRCSSPGGRH